MSILISQQTLVASWNCCEQKKILPKMHAPAVIFSDEVLHKRIHQNQHIIKKFNECIKDVNSYIEGNYLFALTDPNGVLLSVDINRKMSKEVTHYPVYSGVSLSEESCGTNAVALAMKYNDSVYLRSEEHYCHFMKGWYGYAVPLQIQRDTLGYFCLASLNTSLGKETHILVELLAMNLAKAINEIISQPDVQLTDVQKRLILLMSQGFTEKAIALHMSLNINTIKYHKKSIFQKLEVQCSAEAIAKAIKLKLINLADIH